MDVLDAIELTQHARGRIRQIGAAAGTLLMAGWAWKWPLIHPFVQGMIDARAQQLTDAITSAIDGDTKDLGR
jgi:hypothetical protein